VVLETNVPEGEEEYFIELVNPEIIETEGEQEEVEGCLSVPDVWGITKRPARVKVRALDRGGEVREYEGEGLEARCLCHEIDHLDGHLFTERVTHILSPEEVEELMAGQEERDDG
jgi:peptide deformylase